MWYCVYGRAAVLYRIPMGLKLEPTVPPPCLVLHHARRSRLGDDRVLPTTVLPHLPERRTRRFGIFQQTINMNARFVDEGVLTNNGVAVA